MTEKNPKEQAKGHTHVQWISGVVANSTLVTYGLQAGWLSPAAKVLQSQSSPTGAPLSDYTLGWIASLMPITALFFVPLYAFLADRIGRKKCILLMTVPQLACWLLTLFATNLACLIAARVLFGVSAGACFVVVPMYNKEIAQDDIRGAMGSMLVFSFNLGILAVYALGAYLEYYTVLYAVVGLPVLTFLCMLLCPESPGFLVKTGRIHEAAKNLSRLRSLPINDSSLQNELDLMKKQDDYYKTLPNLSLLVILKDKVWRKAYLIASLLLGVQALGGNFALVTYGAHILAASAAGTELHTLSFPAVMMLGAALSVAIMEQVRRRVILLISYSVSALSLGGLATVLLLPTGTVPVWFLMLTITPAMFMYSLGVLPGPYIIMSETFNIQIRAKLMGLVVIQAWAMCFTQLVTFAPITNTLGMHTYFYVCAAIFLFGVFVVLVLLPETRGKSIEEIEKELGR